MPGQSTRAPEGISLATTIASLAGSGVGEKRAQALRRMGIVRVADLILHLPARYERLLGERTVEQAGQEVTPFHGGNANLAVRGEILTTRFHQGARRKRFEATLFDGTGTVLLTWWNMPWLRHKLHPGMTIRASGKAKRHGDYVQLANPRWEPLADESQAAHGTGGERLLPIYPASDEITSAQIERLIDRILDRALAGIDDHLPADFRQERGLPELRDAYLMVHRPGDEDEIAIGRRRLAFDELFLLQLGVMLKRVHRRSAVRAIPLARTAKVDERIRARFPFELTSDQRRVIDEIAADLARDRPMNRLLQGDVGSGKTVVALYAALMAIAAKHQAALMAPTELLAEQHFSTITEMLKGSRVRIALLTGSLKAAQRRELHRQIEAGEIDLIIGTHALLTGAVRFHSLAVAIIDEQHRFGVHQRATLPARSTKEKLVAHTLVMTATPIPRTLSITLYGDLDISTIRGLPPGRAPIATRLMPQSRADEVYEYVAKRIERGEQAYIVVPVIDESGSGLKDVGSHMQFLSESFLHGLRLEAMHGRLKREEREAIMNRFRAGKIDALIATTVIEVGVDVPNASIMLIEHAERFGLAQLHQLRGRVGRGNRRSVCILIGDSMTDDGKARLEAIASTTDGFKIAEKDLEIRGPGELFGTRQSGAAPFRVADLTKDLKLLELARRDAAQWIERNPSLQGDDLSLLRKRLMKTYGDSLGLGDVG
jgi:ATP-dependent DNA helicase RecG